MVQIIGPAALTLLLITGGVVGWVVLAVVFVVAGLVMKPAADWALRTGPSRRATPVAALVEESS
jgi:hypothetical protein